MRKIGSSGAAKAAAAGFAASSVLFMASSIASAEPFRDIPEWWKGRNALYAPRVTSLHDLDPSMFGVLGLPLDDFYRLIGGGPDPAGGRSIAIAVGGGAAF